MLTLDPQLPARLGSLAFSLCFRDRQLRVELTREAERYLLDEGEALPVVTRGCRHVLTLGEPLCLASSAPT